MPIVKLKKANFFRAFGKTINLVRPVAEFTEEEIVKIENDIKSGNIEVVSQKSPEKIKAIEEVVNEIEIENNAEVIGAEIIEEKNVEEVENAEIAEDVKPSRKGKAK